MWRLLFPVLFLSWASAQTSIDSAEYQVRRKAALERIPDGIVLLRAFSGMKHWDESGFHQDASFYYFTGLANLHGAILALDGAQKESWLFVSPRLGSFGSDLHGFDSAFLDPGSQTERELKFDHVVLWDQFVSFVDSRHKSSPKLVLYADGAGQTGQMGGDTRTPSGLGPMENPHLVWSTMLRQKWADVEVKDAFAILDEVRAVKSSAELARMRKAAAVTTEGFWAGVHEIAPGKTQRQVEGRVLDACLQAGSDGPSLWPWVRSGPYALGNKLFEAFLDYDNLDRKMQAGEVVRLDLGCDFQMYKGDFGRTIPVSGHFDEGQRETMELLNGAYLAGVSRMQPGASAKDVVKATTGYIEQHQTELKSATAKQAAANFMKQPNLPLHGLGVDMAEGVPKSFQPGNVLCYEPLLTAGNQAFFVEDTFLIVPAGHETLNPSLPYSPSDIERAMAKR
ncbi:MAG TPA: aminopeptidase P N-terminal domain-containing protein [Candidatus Dormibacteraeota bacterium]|jgi:Xaa-Pro aminopeptidase|nr:aminopeptidase P N-terminal domain-containing protein [Candidatus Dormibacteraeota bacterium]